MDNHLLTQEADKGKKQLAIEAILVEILGRAVRGCHHHDTEIEQLFEQTPDDHRIGDIGDLHLVERQQAQAFADTLCHRGDGIRRFARARLFQPLMHLLHERVKMDTPLSRDGQGFHEHVHQHGFPSPHTAPEIQPLRHILGFVKQPPQKPAFSRGRMLEMGSDIFQNRQDGPLRWIILQFARCHTALVNLGQTPRSLHAIPPLKRLHAGIPASSGSHHPGRYRPWNGWHPALPPAGRGD